MLGSVNDVYGMNINQEEWVEDMHEAWVKEYIIMGSSLLIETVKKCLGYINHQRKKNNYDN